MPLIIVDYSGISLAAVSAQNLPAEEDVLRHVILNSLRSLYSKHKSQYGEMVIACDSKSWRKEYYPYYKYRRHLARQDNNPDYWAEVFRIMEIVLQEIDEVMPWKVVRADGAEADDVIAALALRTQELGYREDVLIISADSDFKQLLRYNNIRQYSNQQKKFVTEADPDRWLHEAILTGQKGKDDIPNIKTRDSFYADKGESERQKSITAKYIAETWANRDALEKHMNSEEYRNFVRNRTLIDFNYMDPGVNERVLDAYDECTETPTQDIMAYLMRNRLNNLMKYMRDFYPKS